MSAINLTKETFDQEVLNSSQPVLIDFWASWCGPCQMMLPIIDAVASEATNAKIAKVNVDEQSELATQFEVMSIPTLVVLKDGKVMDKAVGVQSKEKILQMLNK